MTDESLMEKILLDLHKEVAIVRENQAGMSADLKEHMKRTAIVETEVKYLHKQASIAQGAIAFISLLAILVSLYKSFSS